VPSTEEGLMQMKVSELKAVLDARGVSYTDCVDKIHLVEKIRASSPSNNATSVSTEREGNEADAVTVQAVAVEDEAESVKELPVEKEEESKVKEEPVKEEDNEDDENTNNFGAASFKQKLEFLQAMGFTDQDRNIAALVEHAGHLNGAVAALINENI